MSENSSVQFDATHSNLKINTAVSYTLTYPLLRTARVSFSNLNGLGPLFTNQMFKK